MPAVNPVFADQNGVNFGQDGDSVMEDLSQAQPMNFDRSSQ